jgi:hypothetical protein
MRMNLVVGMDTDFGDLYRCTLYVFSARLNLSCHQPLQVGPQLHGQKQQSRPTWRGSPAEVIFILGERNKKRGEAVRQLNRTKKLFLHY